MAKALESVDELMLFSCSYRLYRETKRMDDGPALLFEAKNEPILAISFEDAFAHIRKHLGLTLGEDRIHTVDITEVSLIGHLGGMTDRALLRLQSTDWTVAEDLQT